MADDIQGLPPGAVVKPIQQQPIEGLPAGAVVKPLASSSPDQSTDNVQQPEQPQPSAASRLGNNLATGLGAMPGTNEEVKQKLVQIANHPVDTTTQFAKGVLDAQGELAHKAKDAWQKGDHVGAAAYALYYLMPGIGPQLAKSGEQYSSGDIAGGLGTNLAVAGQLAAGKLAPAAVAEEPGFAAAEATNAKTALAGKAPVTTSASELAPTGKVLKDTGETIKSDLEQKPAGQYPHTPEDVQSELAKHKTNTTKKAVGEKVQSSAQALRDTKGKAVGAAKDQVEASLQGVADNTAEPSSFPKDGHLATTAKSVLDDIGSANQLAGAKDPDMADVEAMAGHLQKGANAQGEPLSVDPKQADSINRAFSAKIDGLQAKAEAGGNASALRHVRALKTAYNNDLFDAYEQQGDPAAAQNLRKLSKDYAQLVDEQTSGPARGLLKNPSPEKIVSSLVSGGSNSQSAIESLNKVAPGAKATLAEGVKNEILSRATKDGAVDAVKARDMLNKMGVAGKTVLGDAHKPFSTLLEDAAKKQTDTGESGLTATQTSAPERIISDIVTGGPKAQSTVEGLLKRVKTPENQDLIRNGVLNEIFRKNTSPEGLIDMAQARKDFYQLGDTAKSLYGSKLKDTYEYLDAAAKEQTARQVKADKTSAVSTIAKKAIKAVGTGSGALIGSTLGPVGEIAGAISGGAVSNDVVEGLFNQGKSGAVKIGISPTEQIVLSPAEAAAKRSGITKFLKAKSTKNAAAMTAAYSALKGETPSSAKAEDRGSL